MTNQKDIEKGIRAMITENPDLQRAVFNSVKGGENVNNIEDAFTAIKQNLKDAELKDNNGNPPFGANDFFPNLVDRILFQVIPVVRELTHIFDKYGAMGMIDNGDGYEAIGNNPRDAKLHDLSQFVPLPTDKMTFYNQFLTVNYKAVTTTWYFARAIATATVSLSSLANILAKIIKTLSDEIDLVKTYLEPKVLKNTVTNEVTINSGDPTTILKSVFDEVSGWYWPSTEHNIIKDGVPQLKNPATTFKSLNTSWLKDIILIINGKFFTVWNTEIKANSYNQQFINQDNWGGVERCGIEYAQPAQVSVTNTDLAKAFPAEENTLYAIDKSAFLTFIQTQGRTNQQWLQGQISQSIYERGAVHLIGFMNGVRFKYQELKTNPTNVLITNTNDNPVITKEVTPPSK